MAFTSYPFDNQDTTESQFSMLFRELGDTGVADSSNSNGMQVTGDASGMNVKIAAGRAIVRGHMSINDGVVTQTIDAATTSPRIDLVVLRLDPSLNSIVPAVVKGTPAASPTVPTLTQTDTGIYELLLAQVAVAANAPNISAANVTDKRSFVGNEPLSVNANNKPPTARVGQLVRVQETGVWEEYTGTAYQPLLRPMQVANDAAMRALPTSTLYRGQRVSDMATTREWEWTGAFWRLLTDLPRLSALVTVDSPIGTGGWSSIGFGTRTFDNWLALNTNGGLYTFPIKGIYAIHFLGTFDLRGEITPRGVRLAVKPNGGSLTTLPGSATITSSAQNVHTAIPTTGYLLEVNVGDVLYPQMYQATGANVNVKGINGALTDQITSLRLNLIEQTG